MSKVNIPMETTIFKIMKIKPVKNISMFKIKIEIIEDRNIIHVLLLPFLNKFSKQYINWKPFSQSISHFQTIKYYFVCLL